MKTIAKLSLAALAVALTGSASADHLKLEIVPDAHGGFRFQYRAAEPTIAVYSEGRSVGQQMAVSAPELRLEWRDTGHGFMRPQYVAVK